MLQSYEAELSNPDRYYESVNVIYSGNVVQIEDTLSFQYFPRYIHPQGLEAITKFEFDFYMKSYTYPPMIFEFDETWALIWKTIREMKNLAYLRVKLFIPACSKWPELT